MKITTFLSAATVCVAGSVWAGIYGDLPDAKHAWSVHDRNRPNPVKVTAEGVSYEGLSAIVTACNGQYYGGGFRPSIDARPDDGRMEVFLVKEVKLYEFPGLIGKYSKGNWRAISEEKLMHFYTDEVLIETPEPVVVNVDGEALYSDHINFTLVPGGVNFIVPKGLAMFR